MKNLAKQTIITGAPFTLHENVEEIDILEEKYVASIVNREDGQILIMNCVWRINLSAFKQLKQINIFDQGKKTVLMCNEQGMFPEFQIDQLGAYTEMYTQLNTYALVA